MSQITDLLKQLGSQGIRLFLEQGQLRFNAPKGAMTPELMAALKANKEELIRLLQQAADTDQTLTEPLTACASSKLVPLSYAQQRLWFLYKLEGRSSTYNILMASRFHGALNIDVLTRSFDFLIKRHECLRTTFTENEDGIALQSIHDSVPLNIRQQDLSSYPEQQKQQLLAAAKQQLAATGFDLEQAPLAKVVLIQYAKNDWILLMAMHHIIGDGWSMGILSRELSAAYQSLCNAQQPSQPAITISYRDYSLWQQRDLQKQWIDQGLKKWCRLLEGSEYSLELNTGNSRPETRSYQGSVFPVEIPARLTSQLEQLAETRGVSLFVLLLSVYFILLQRYSGRNDLLIGTQAANRHESALEAIVGFFINTLPLRGKLNGNPTFSEFVQQIKQFSLQAFELQYVPFERLVETLKPERDFGSNPLVQYMFLWQNAPIDDMALSGLTISREPIKSEAAKFDLTLELGLEQGQIKGVFEYRTNLFDVATIDNMVQHYTYLLHSIVQNPDTVIGNLSLIPQAEESGRLSLPDNTQNIIDLFNKQADETPEAPALNDGQQVLTYRQLSRQSEELAVRIQQAGIKAGSVIAVYLPRSTDYLLAIVGILKAGCAYLPLEQTLPKARVDFILKDADVAAVISEDHTFAEYPLIECSLARGTEPDIQITQSSIHSQTPAYLIYTSGSTGQPKGVVVSHQSVLALVASLNKEIYHDRPGGLNIALMASFIFDASVQQIFATLLQGHCLHICDTAARRDGQAVLDFFQQQQVEVTDCTPSLLQIMLDAGLADLPHSSLRQIIVGGEALPSQLIDTIANSRQADSLQVFNVYGPTECTVDSTLYAVNNIVSEGNGIVSLGGSLDHAQIIIADQYGNRQPDGLAGEILISGTALAQGYWHQPGLTAERFIPGENGSRWYRTGDQGRINSNGEIEFIGRLDDQVKIRGYRIELGEIENQLLNLSAIQQAAVCHKAGELLAYIVTEKQPSLAELRASLALQLPDYMLPTHFIVVEQMPLSPSGKIDRKALSALDRAQRLSDRQGGAAKGERESLLAKVWCEVLGLDSIGRDDNYFASGGDSIKALQIVSRVRKYGYKLEVRDIFTHTCISQLAPRLTLIDQSGLVDSARPQGELALSPIQQHFFQHHGNHYQHFNQAFLLSTHSIDVARLKTALSLVCAQHDAFRLRFKQQDKQWRQYFTDGDALDISVQEVDQTEQITKHAAGVQQSFDLTTGPLFKVVCYQLPEQTFVLLVAHHLIIDAVSWRILMDDIDQAYEQGEQWQPSEPGPSLQAWMNFCRQHSDKIILEEKDYWQQFISPAIDNTTTHYRDLDIIKTELDTSFSEQFLTGAHHAYSTEANDLLLAALVKAYWQWTRQPGFSLILEGHGRDALAGIDLSRTLGWFTTRYPVTLQYPEDQDMGFLIKQVKESLRAVPHKGIGYGFNRYLNPHNEGLTYTDPAISFNYLGQFGAQQQGHFAISDLPIGDIIAPDATPPYLIEFVGKHMAGRLSFEIAYAGNVYSKEQVEQLVHYFKTALIEIIQHTTNIQEQSLTPSDIDYDGFDINQLDDFLEQL